MKLNGRILPNHQVFVYSYTDKTLERLANWLVFLVLNYAFNMLMSTQFSLAYTCACAYAYAYALVKTRL